MWIDFDSFTPIESLLGGLLIGMAALILILFCGRVMGVSGILGGLFQKHQDKLWRLAFLTGVFLAPWAYQWIMMIKPEAVINTSYGALIVAGLLVGVGTRLGSGCTSGHSVCGLSRFSFRSLIYTLIFMAIAMGTVFIVSIFK
ncbi:YeeE/YedE family protein [Thorsellia kenyensis]|uniref:YeeE/YedE family protein n=1 Tax=Thorsellia kenyensis TaxID=1549888 RepID=A0ABV6CEG0_9GAMM